MDTGTTVVNGTVWAVSNVASWAANVVTNSVNNVAWSILPEQAAQWVANFTNTVSQWAQTLWEKATDTIKDAWETAKWFFSGLWGNIKWTLSNSNAQKVMDEANAPLETPQQPAPQAQQPASQPAATAPEVNQQVAPQANQPTPEVQAWDIQQPTNPA